jgi:hypothetical protein
MDAAAAAALCAMSQECFSPSQLDNGQYRGEVPGACLIEQHAWHNCLKNRFLHNGLNSYMPINFIK